MGGIPPPSGGIVGENRRTRSKTTVRSKRVGPLGRYLSKSTFIKVKKTITYKEYIQYPVESTYDNKCQVKLTKLNISNTNFDCCTKCKDLFFWRSAV